MSSNLTSPASPPHQPHLTSQPCLPQCCCSLVSPCVLTPPPDPTRVQGYVVFHLDFELMRVLCEAEGARCVAAYRRAGAPRFAAVSGLNTTLALALQAALQLLFSRLEPQMQFRVLAAIFLALFAAYAGHSVVAGLTSSCGMTRPGSDDTARGADDEAREEGQRYHCYDAAGSGTPST
jgi:hypothetical protein